MKTRNHRCAEISGIAAIVIMTGFSVIFLGDAQAQEPGETETSSPGATVDESELADINARLAAIESRQGPAATDRELLERRIVVGLEIYAEMLETSYSDLIQRKASLEARIQELEEQVAAQQ